MTEENPKTKERSTLKRKRKTDTEKKKISESKAVKKTAIRPKNRKRVRRKSMAKPLKKSRRSFGFSPMGFLRKRINTLSRIIRSSDIRFTLEDFISLEVHDRKRLGRTYQVVDSVTSKARRARHAAESFWRKLFRFSYQIAVGVLVLAGVYYFTTGTLSAPRSFGISTRSEWSAGTLSNVTTETYGNNVDAIELESDGTWKARVWAPPPDTIGFGHSSVLAGNYIYAFRGYADSAFWRYDTINNTWEELPDLPQPAHYGADLTYISSQGKIYAMFGGYSMKFYSFDVSTKEWTRLADLPDSIYAGAAMETDGSSVYVTRGNNTTAFWKYSASDASPAWSNLDPVPSGATVSTGGDLVNGQDGGLYLVRGNTTQNFYRYNLSTRDWETTVASLPATCGGACTMAGEQKGAYWTDGSTKYLYFFRSNGTNYFLRYQINGSSPNTWTAVSASEAIPAVTNFPSLNYNPSDGLIYAIRGNYTYDTWRFNPAAAVGQQWIGPKQVQDSSGNLQTVSTGGDLIWDGSDYVYAVRGASTNGFYRYQLSTNTWTTQATVSYGTVGNDVKGTFYNGNVYFPRYGNNTIYTFNGTAWGSLTDLLPGNIGEGGSLAYNASDSRMYALRGAGTANLYYRATTGGAWGTAANMSVSDAGTTVTYYANTGARLVSDQTNLYVMVGDGETAFLSYNTGANNWTKLAPTPFAQHYGADMTYVHDADPAKRKIYALAGQYKDETWEYTISTNSWRRLPNNQEYVFDRGPQAGASLEYVGANTLLATPGLGLSDMWSYTISSSAYKTSGTYESQSIDLTDVASWISFTTNFNEPSGTTISYETMTSSDGTNWQGSWDAVTQVSKVGGAYTGTIISSANRYIKVRITLTSDGTATPTVKDFNIAYNTDDEAPTNPTVISGSSQQAGGVPLTSGEKYSYEHPYFSWSGATDSGAGIAGYYVCFGKSDACVDPETDGIFQTAGNYTVNETMEFDSGQTFGTYYVKVKTKDNNGVVATEELASFTYKYTGVSPTLSTLKTTESDFQSGTTSKTSVVSTGDGAVRLQSANGFWNQTRLSLEPGAVQRGGELAIGTCQGSSNHCLYTFRGDSASPYNQFQAYVIETDTWVSRAVAPGAVGFVTPNYGGGGVTEGPEGYLYAVRGGNTSDFWMYNIGSDAWSVLDSVPAPVTYGSNLVYDGIRYVYCLPGNDDAFFKYDTCNGAGGGCVPGWSTLQNANFNNPNSVDGQKVYEGSDSIFVGEDTMYVVQGNYYPYFAKYTVTNAAQNQGSWTSLAQAPVGFYDGGSLAYDSNTHAIYALAGNARKKFFKYDITADIWTELPETPATISYGASLIVSDGYIYAQRGSNSTAFYRFNIEENSWELPTRGFFGAMAINGSTSAPYGGYYYYYNGAQLANDAVNNLYVIRGNYDNVFGKYNVSTGAFTELAKLPVGATSGASLAFVDDKGTQGSIYYSPGVLRTVRTSNNNYLYRYDVATNIWTEITSSRPNAQTNAGSSMVYDGSQYLYLTQGNNTGVWWRMDINNETWTTLPTSGFAQQDGAKMVFVENGANDKIYALRGGNTTTYYVCNVASLPGSNCWSTVPNSPAGAVNTGGSLLDGGDGYLYAIRGGNTNNYYRWPIAGGAWETTPTIPTIPANITNGGAGTNLANRNWTTAGYVTSGLSYSDGLYSYVVGSSANGTGFEKTGTYTSPALDLTDVYKWANLTTTYTLPNNTFVAIQTRSSDDDTACENAQCDNKDWSSWVAVSNDHADGNIHAVNINSSPKRFLQIKYSLTSSDRIFSPVLTDYKINYYQDVQNPTNPSAVSAYSSVTKETTINNEAGNIWYNHTQPYFEWPTANTTGGASDNEGGSGIAGYYVCFGTTDDCSDPYTDGQFQTGNSFTAPALSITDSGKVYRLLIKAIDNAQMIPAEAYLAFTYNFDIVPPTNPSDINVTPAGFTSSDNYTFTWQPDASDASSTIAKLQYRTGGDAEGVWYDITDTSAVSVALPNEQHVDAAYQSNKNVFYLRIVDKAGNVSTPITQDYYFSGDAPTPPRNLIVNPETSTVNEFTFTWEAPESFSGDASKIKYRYSINTLPSDYNTVETSATAAGPGPFATQKGTNRFYVAAVDEAGNVDYNLTSYVEFFADTSAPPMPGNVQAFDTSDREAQEYSVAVKWSTPDSLDEGNFAGYVIYRSEDNQNFSEVATTTGSAYVDTNLESKLYYYYVKSKDKTNNYSIASSTVSLTPTGRYTKPPTIVTQPSVEAQSFEATISWSTNRNASSFVEFGKAISLGDTNGQVDDVTAHVVNLTGLDADTKYYYRVKYIDPDGNIGTSKIENFTTLPPPTISDVKISEVGLNTAIIQWTTNTNATCTLKYGKGSYTNTIEESSAGSTHVQRLEGLESATTYKFQITAIDSDENNFNSDEYTFTTLEQPKVSDLTVENRENVDLPTVVVRYKTSHPTTTLVKFKTASESNFHNYLKTEISTDHEAVIEGLDGAVEYNLLATGVDQNGIEAASNEVKITTLSDSRPPGIVTNRAIGKVVGRGKEAKANLYVKIETDETTTTKVLFDKGTVVNNFGQNTPEDGLNTYHLITIPAETGQVYSYVVEAKDEAGNKTTTKPITVVIEGAKENATEIVVSTFGSKFGWLANIWKR